MTKINNMTPTTEVLPLNTEVAKSAAVVTTSTKCASDHLSDHLGATTPKASLTRPSINNPLDTGLKSPFNPNKMSAPAHGQQLLVEEVKGEYGDSASRRVNGWFSTIEKIRDEPLNKKILHVDDHVNMMLRYVSDQNAYGKSDYWATPWESTINGKGDCEDFAVAKYAMLREAGVPADRLKLTYVRATTRTGKVIAHLVLTARLENDTLVILDNMTVRLTLPSERTDLRPVFEFNENGINLLDSTWQSKEKRLPIGDYKKWGNVLEQLPSDPLLPLAFGSKNIS
ncbi:transglutaminase-like cysteine peptidase [Myxococcota bacterium]|nr:transglutaminase-like cysteine peptidase [Myxococcota bacterium]